MNWGESVVLDTTTMKGMALDTNAIEAIKVAWGESRVRWRREKLRLKQG